VGYAPAGRAVSSSSLVPEGIQAAWVSRALHRLWVAGVGFVDWEFLNDPYPTLRLESPIGGALVLQRPAGLYDAGPGGDLWLARPKAFLRGFTLPFDPLRVNRRQVRVWALLMRPGQPVALQRQSRAGAVTEVWRTIASLRADRYGVLNVLVDLRGPVRLRVVSGTLTSAAAPVGSASLRR
jgi:hypothetical protein